MRSLIVAGAVALLGGVLGAADSKERAFRFGKDDANKVPAGWKVDQTNEGKGSAWKVVADDTAPSKAGYVLAQVAEGPKQVFNLCVAEDTNYQDVEVTVSLKAVKGQEDQGGGVVWRYQDAKNYYIARQNPLEGNYRVYKIVNGKRLQLETEEGVTAKAGEWHVLKIKMVGNRIECFFDGKKFLDAKDDAIAKAGKVGLWTKADAQTHFDGFRVTGLGK